MQPALGDFIHALRLDGVPVSQAETLDALHAVRLVGPGDREALKRALGMTLAKCVSDKLRHDALFDRFFAPPAQDTASDAEATGDEADASPRADEGGGGVRSALGRALLADAASAFDVAIAAAAGPAGAREMQVFSQRGPVGYRILQALGDGELRAELAELAERNEHALLVQQLRAARERLRQRIDEYVERQYLLYTRPAGQRLREETLRRIRLSNVELLQSDQMMRVIRKAARQLAALYGRRRRVSRRGLLDVQKTIAANAAFDGVLMHTRWKSTRIERPDVMLLCDVSGSVSWVARFLLMFLYSLQDVLPRVRSFVFAGELVEVTGHFDRADAESAIGEIMHAWAGRSSNYSRAMEDFAGDALGDVDKRTTVIMLGDARTNGMDGNVRVWRQVYRRARRVLWLNPEPRSAWDTGDSIMSEYAVFCSRAEPCNSVDDITRVFGSLLRYD